MGCVEQTQQATKPLLAIDRNTKVRLCTCVIDRNTKVQSYNFQTDFMSPKMAKFLNWDPLNGTILHAKCSINSHGNIPKYLKKPPKCSVHLKKGKKSFYTEVQNQRVEITTYPKQSMIAHLIKPQQHFQHWLHQCYIIISTQDCHFPPLSCINKHIKQPQYLNYSNFNKNNIFFKTNQQ